MSQLNAEQWMNVEIQIFWSEKALFDGIQIQEKKIKLKKNIELKTLSNAFFKLSIVISMNV